MSDEELKAEIEKLKAENEDLKKEKKPKELTFKVSQKGAVSVYGMGRFPVTLYKEQWRKLLKKTDEILEFITENEDSLTSKD